jgi:ABC-type branched-subunit amino acid transport system substrate-binding protein
MPLASVVFRSSCQRESNVRSSHDSTTCRLATGFPSPVITRTCQLYPLKDLHTGNTVAFETQFNVDGTGFYEEDVLLITANGYQLINPDLPYSATDVETLMSRLKRSKK